jgi:predicted MFS family arabinose efflux permease
MRKERTLSLTGPGVSEGGLGRARLSVSLIFLIHGILVSNWLARIPAVRQNLGLAVGVLGTVLLATAAGALIGMPLTSKLVGRFGSAPITRISTLALCGCIMLPGLAWNALVLAVALFLYGAAAGVMDVAMNTEAVAVETGFGRPVMVGFHAMFSFGGMIGSLMGSVAASRGIQPAWHLGVVGAAMAVAAVPVCRQMLPNSQAAAPDAISTRELLRPLLGLGLIAFCILLGEGAMADWSAVYLQQLAGPGVAPLGYAVFSLSMALGRLRGDWIHQHLGSVATVRWGGALAAVGLGAALLIGGMPATLAGFACVGWGFSAIYPIVCSVAGNKAGGKPEAGIAAVSGTGYFGFLVGPPVIGLLAQMWSLRAALLLVVVLSGLSSLMARIARTPGAPPLSG